MSFLSYKSMQRLPGVNFERRDNRAVSIIGTGLSPLLYWQIWL